MRDCRLFDGKSALEIAHAHLAAPSDKNAENCQANRMGEEFQISARPLERLKIDLRSRADGASGPARSLRRVDNEPCSALRHMRMVTNVSKTVNTSGSLNKLRHAFADSSMTL